MKKMVIAQEEDEKTYSELEPPWIKKKEEQVIGAAWLPLMANEVKRLEGQKDLHHFAHPAFDVYLSALSHKSANL